MSDGMLSVAVVHAIYRPDRKPLLELLYDDWCEPDQLPQVIGAYVDLAANMATSDTEPLF